MPVSPLQDLVERLGRALPPGMAMARDELKDNFKAILQAQLGELNLVSREEFEVQQELLKRLRKRVEQLEARIAAWEALQP